MKAVATITPDPKYLAKKKAQDGIRREGFFFATTGKRAPGRVHIVSIMPQAGRGSSKTYQNSRRT